jgi:hypothetical protein
LVTGPRWAPDTRTDWPTVGRKLTATATIYIYIRGASGSVVIKVLYYKPEGCGFETR